MYAASLQQGVMRSRGSDVREIRETHEYCVKRRAVSHSAAHLGAIRVVEV